MSFGAGMATGIGAGMGSGIAIGIASGKKKACQDVMEYFESEGITLFGRDGKPLDIEQVMEQATNKPCTGSSNKTALVILCVIGALVALALVATLLAIAL